MKKKTFILVTVIFVYFIYKCCYLFYYNINNITVINYNEIINSIGKQNTITIKRNILEEDKYLKINDAKLRNDFKDFKKLDGNGADSDKYLLYDNNKVKAAFWATVTDSYVDRFKNNHELFGINNKNISKQYISNFYNKNNIKNDIDLFNYLKDKKNIKNNIFTSVNKMKENYMIQFFTAVSMPIIDSITLISGDYDGYIFNLSSSGKEVSILKNNKRYVFTFLYSEYFDDSFIEDLISTIVIK